MTTAAAIITQARRLLADKNDNSFEQSDLLAYLNEGCQRFAVETHVCQFIVNYTITNSQLTFDTLKDEDADIEEILQIGKVELISENGSTFLPLAPMWEKKTRLAAGITTPTRYSIFADSIIFDTYSGETLSLDANIYLTYKPSALTTEGEIKIPSEWEEAIVKYIVFCAALSVRDSGNAAGAFEEYSQLRDTARQAMLARTG